MINSERNFRVKHAAMPLELMLRKILNSYLRDVCLVDLLTLTVRFGTGALLNVGVRVGYYVSIKTTKRDCTIACEGCLATATGGQPGFSVPVYERQREINIISYQIY